MKCLLERVAKPALTADALANGSLAETVANYMLWPTGCILIVVDGQVVNLSGTPSAPRSYSSLGSIKVRQLESGERVTLTV